MSNTKFLKPNDERGMRARDPADPIIPTPERAAALGQRLKHIRKTLRWTQGDLAARSGVAASTISKVENNQLSPSFETILRLAEGLGVDVTDLLAPNSETAPKTRRVITRRGQGERHDTHAYVYEFLCTELKTKQMHPLIARLKAHSIQEFGPLLRHPGEELLLVLKGRVELHTEHYQPAILAEGDCAYLDSSMGHGCISAGDQDAIVFWVSMVAER